MKMFEMSYLVTRPVRGLGVIEENPRVLLPYLCTSPSPLHRICLRGFRTASDFCRAGIECRPGILPFLGKIAFFRVSSLEPPRASTSTEFPRAWMKECFFDIPLFGFDPSLVCAMLAVGFNNKLFLAVRTICKGTYQRSVARDRVFVRYNFSPLQINPGKPFIDLVFFPFNVLKSLFKFEFFGITDENTIIYLLELYGDARSATVSLRD